MPILKNQKHELFAQSLAKGETARKAYSDAGYEDNRKNAWRLKTNKDIIERVAELQCNAARSCEVSIQSLIRELDDAIGVAKAKGQAQALVSAAGMKAKLTGLMVERQRIEVSQPGWNGWNDDTPIEQIIREVVAETGVKRAYYLALAFDFNPSDFGLSLDGEPASVVTTSRPVASTSPRSGVSQRAVEWRPSRPADRKREIGLSTG